jgi:hypothetical protein
MVMEPCASQSASGGDIGAASQGFAMRVAFKITRTLLGHVFDDLNRPHPFAAERVGFLSCRVGELKPSGWIVLAYDFHQVADGDYLRDRTVGAMIGPAAIRKAMQIALSDEVCMFHVHVHGHCGQPSFSGVDLRETAKFVPDFWHFRQHLVHGAIVLSLDSAAGLCWHPQYSKPFQFSDLSTVGAPMSVVRSVE